ncbi:hypothetical protein Glove_229g44 [Diversispora epigaea]|uniref:TLDc domain-containing protein n=1 Tax=Diversispora epigaea TaxID=1348612 RepID=A0A397ID40_9GLOM|nr:hypothetical protein Glove_229g44 [Diversispora epigaea]
MKINLEKPFISHSVVLRYRSTHFSKKLDKTATNDNNVKTIFNPNISTQIFKIILKDQIIYELLIVANELEFKELSEKLEKEIEIWDYVIKWGIAQNPTLPKNLEEWSKENFKTLKTTLHQCLPLIRYFPISEKDIWEKLKPYRKILDQIIYELLIVANELEFKELSEKLEKEIEIWDYVIKWGIAQNPTLPKNLEEWSKENFKTLKTTLHQCLPLIRYFPISEKDIWEKLKPYRKILVKSLVLLARIVSNPELPQRVNEQISTIINEEHQMCHINFNGFQPQTFWDMCNGHAGTIVIDKVAGTDEIFGGYNPLAWNNSVTGIFGDFMETNDSLIFSLKNGNIQNSILSRVSLKTCGPCFGDSEFYLESNAFDFTQDKQCECYGSSYYEKSIKTTEARFSIVDYEVFKIVKK